MARGTRALATALATGAMLGAATAPAAAWPIPFSPDQVAYLNAVRGAFPGNDDQLMLVGLQICRQLYTGQSPSAVIDTVSAQYAASRDQAAAAMNAARRTMCTRA